MSLPQAGVPAGRPPGGKVYDAGLIAERTQALGSAITNDYASRLAGGAAVVLVGVLQGCLPFLADLVRSVRVECEIDFLAISRFAPNSGRVRITRDLDIDIGGRHVLLVEGIVDSGLSVGFLTGELRRRGPLSVEVCTLLDRQARRILPLSRPATRGSPWTTPIWSATDSITRVATATSRICERWIAVLSSAIRTHSWVASTGCRRRAVAIQERQPLG